MDRKDIWGISASFDDGCFNPQHPHNHNVFYSHTKNFYHSWYNDRADYNTNAPSYYDYLARRNHLLKLIQDAINKLLDRNIEFNDSKTIDFSILGDWQQLDDVITVTANVILSKAENNAIKQNEDGIYAFDFSTIIAGLQNSITSIQNAINNLNNKVSVIEGNITNISNAISVLSSDISGIKSDISNIYKILDYLLNGGSFTPLEKGRDYDLTFYNGFYTDTGNLVVGIMSFNTYDYVSISSITSGGSLLRNDKLVNVKMRHGGDLMDVPESWIYGIVFKGDYAYLNASSGSRISGKYTDIWNVSPTSLRASYLAGISSSREHPSQTLLVNIITYADGYNTQFTVYNDNTMKLHDATLNVTYRFDH